MKKLLLIFCNLYALGSIAQPSLLKYGQAVMSSGVYSSSGSWSFLVYDLRDDGTAIPYTNWPVATYHPAWPAASDWTFSRTGPIFGITIDLLGNIYLASSKVLNSTWGPGTAGHGGVYKIDAYSWAVSDFLVSDPVYTYNPVINKIPNKTDGLGDICYDSYNDQLFVSNFEDGVIYRIDMSGNILSVYDPFGTDPAVDAISPLGERTWALNVYKSGSDNAKLYFSRVNEDMCTPLNRQEVWSLELNPVSGDFMGPEQLVLTFNTSMSTYNAPISDICFDKSGNMYLAQRAACGLFNQPHSSSVFRYNLSGGSYVYDQHYFLGDYSGTDGAGGIDIGAKYSPVPVVAVCENKIWATSDAVIFTPPFVYGITGIPITGNTDDTLDPAYFRNVNLAVDHNSMPGDMPKGLMGDLEIFRDICVEQTIEPVDLPTGWETSFNPGKPSYSKPPTNGTLIHGPVFKPGPACTSFFGLVFHNIITDNDDGTNEEIQLNSLCSPGQLMVYNSIGTCIYKTEGIDLFWDARDLEENRVEEGVYYCVFTYAGNVKNWTVHVTR